MHRAGARADWKVESDYPSARGTSMHRWATEFLSRNAKFLTEVKGFAELSKLDRRRRWREIADKFGIAFPVLAAWGGDSTVVFGSTPYGLQSDVVLGGLKGRWFVGPDHGWGAALVFDLRKPIAPQVRAAERLLKGTRRAGIKPLPGTQRDRRADYQAMLRVLDARALLVPWKAIATEIFPKRSKGIDYVKKLHRKAVALRNGGYKHLPSLAVGRQGK